MPARRPAFRWSRAFGEGQGLESLESGKNLVGTLLFRGDCGHGSGRAGGRGRSPGLFFRRDVLNILAHYEQYIIRYFGVWTKDCAKGT